MLTQYGLEREARSRAERIGRESCLRSLHSGGAPPAAIGRTPTLRLASALRAIADRLEARAVRAA